jgi:hypothetical protein
MSNPTKEYLEGETRAMEDDAGVSMQSPFANPYDERDEPEKAFEWQCGYNNFNHNRRKNMMAQMESEGSWYDPYDSP